MADRKDHDGHARIVLFLDRGRLQPYRFLARSERDTRERGFLTPLALERHLTLIENIPEAIARLKIREMESRTGGVVLDYPRRGALKTWS